MDASVDSAGQVGADQTAGPAAVPAEQRDVAQFQARCSTAHENPAKSSCKSRASRDKVQTRGDASLTAALGGLLAVTGSVLSYALVRVRGTHKHLKEGLEAKNKALAATRHELKQAKQQLQSLTEAAERRAALEAELAASRDNLERMTRELEAARKASSRIEDDMATYQDQLQSLASTEQQAAEAMAAAEQRVADADSAKLHAEQRWRKAYQELDAAQSELENLKGELGLRGSQLENMTRELDFTRRQLANAEKRVEQVQLEQRSARAGYAGTTYDAWD